MPAIKALKFVIIGMNKSKASHEIRLGLTFALHPTEKTPKIIIVSVL